MNQGFSRKWSKVKPTSFSIACARRQLAEVQRRLAGADVAVGLEQDAGVERLLVADVVVEHPLVGAGPLGDPVDARAVEPVLDELLARGDQDVALGPRRVARPPRRRRARAIVCGRRSWRLLRPDARLTAAQAGDIVTELLLHWQWTRPCRPTSGGSPSSAPGTAAPAPGAGTCRRPAATRGARRPQRRQPGAPRGGGGDARGRRRRRSAPTSTRCSAASRPHTLVVCTRDDTHADIIVHALERGHRRRHREADGDDGRGLPAHPRRRGAHRPAGRRGLQLPLRADLAEDPRAARRGADRRGHLGRLPLVSRYRARRRLLPPLARLQAPLRHRSSCTRRRITSTC